MYISFLGRKTHINLDEIRIITDAADANEFIIFVFYFILSGPISKTDKNVNTIDKSS
jgi:hypothetical protein